MALPRLSLEMVYHFKHVWNLTCDVIWYSLHRPLQQSQKAKYLSHHINFFFISYNNVRYEFNTIHIYLGDRSLYKWLVQFHRRVIIVRHMSLNTRGSHRHRSLSNINNNWTMEKD